MANDDLTLGDDTRSAAAAAWFDYLELLDPFRPDLFRYCRGLTGNVFDAEDLAQDTLEQGFAKLGSVHHPIDNPRAYLLRIASNRWVDGIRKSQAESAAVSRMISDPTRADANSRIVAKGHSVRDAGALLLKELAPQERAAVMLKDVFGYSLTEISQILGTSEGAVKSALHRGRGRLHADSPAKPVRPTPTPAAVEQFVACYNARDLEGLLSLMLDGATIELTGHVYEEGRAAFEREGGWFHHNFYNPVDGEPTDAFWEIAEFRGVPVILVLYGEPAERVLGSVMRIEAHEDRIAHIRVYALCPDVVAEVAEDLGRVQGPLRLYRFPFRISD